MCGYACELRVALDEQVVSLEESCGNPGGAGAGKRVNDEIALISEVLDEVAHEAHGFLGGVAWLPILQGPVIQDGDGPDLVCLSAIIAAPYDDVLVPDAGFAVRFFPDVGAGVKPSRRRRWCGDDGGPEKDHVFFCFFRSQVKSGDAIDELVAKKSAAVGVWWVGDDAIDALVGHAGQDCQAIRVEYLIRLHVGSPPEANDILCCLHGGSRCCGVFVLRVTRAHWTLALARYKRVRAFAVT